MSDTTPLRIGVDARPLSHPVTGIGRYTRELVTRLCQSNRCKLFLYSDRPLQPDYAHLPGARIRHGRCSGSMVSSLFAQFMFPRWARWDQIDVFWSPRHHLPLAMPKDIPCVVTIHDLVWKRHPGTMSRRGRWLERLLMPWAMRRSERIIAVSNHTGADIAELFPSESRKVTCIYPGQPEISEYIEPRDESSRYVLFVGTNEPRKNLHTLLKAWGALPQSTLAGARLKLAGGDGWGDDPRNQLGQLGIAGSVDLLGWVDDDQLATLYAGATALVMPSWYEGFGLPLLEAMAYGVPAITANNSAMPEVIGDAGILVDAASVQELSGAISNVLEDSKLRASLSERAIARAGTFCWDRASVETLEVLESVHDGN